MMDMVERVGEALRDQCMVEFGSTWSYDVAWRLATAAIEAMRDPTPKMLRAAGSAMSPGKRPTEKHVSERAKHGIRYRAMIDEALTK